MSNNKINKGNLVYLTDPPTRVLPIKPYTRTERLIRWCGRKLSIKRLTTYNQRLQIPAGVAVGKLDDDGFVEVAVSGAFVNGVFIPVGNYKVEERADK